METSQSKNITSEVNDILYRFLSNIGLAEKGFINTKNKELKYDLLYPTGVVLTVEKEQNEIVWKADIEKLKQEKPNQISTYAWAKKKTRSIDITKFSEDEITLLVECKYIFGTIDDCVDIKRHNVSSILWGCVYSVMTICEQINIFSNFATDYKNELQKIIPFEIKSNFFMDVVPVWQNFFSLVSGNDYRNAYRNDFRKNAGNLPDELKSDISKAIYNIGNTAVHRIGCEAAIQGAMIHMIEIYEPKNEAEREAKEKALNSLGGFTKTIPDSPAPAPITYDKIKPGTTGLTGKQVNKISGAAIFQGMNFNRRVIMMGKNYFDNDSNDKEGIIYYEGHNVRKDETDKNPFNVDQPRTRENAKFCNAVDAYKKGSEPAYINVFHNHSPNKWEYKGIYALIDYEYVNSLGRMVYRFKLKRHYF